MLHRLPRILATITTTTEGNAIIASPQAQILLAEHDEEGSPSTFTILGYRQTSKPGCKGGRLLNANYFRFRHGRMRAIARTFRGKPFLTAHDWGDVRSRGGTLVDSWCEPPRDAADELGIFTRVELTAEWAIKAYAEKLMDRFSIGASGVGEITCTVHGTPVWTECYCWPGYEAEEGTVEWEYEDAIGKEFSAVNVDAVEGTGVVEAELEAELGPGIRAEIAARTTSPITAALDKLSELCGRAWNPDAIAALVTSHGGGAPKGGFPRAAPAITIAESYDDQSRGNLMDRALLCQSLGLPVTATDAEIQAKLTALNSSASQVAVLQAQLGDVATARERDALNAHVEAEITRLSAAREVGEGVIASLRTVVSAPNTTVAAQRASFDSSLKLVEQSAPIKLKAGAAPAAGSSLALQSDARPATAPGGELVASEVDAFEQNKSNPQLARVMKACRVTAANVREHGQAEITVEPKLKELADATASRA